MSLTDIAEKIVDKHISEIEVVVTCPKCKEEFTARYGEVECPRCRYRFETYPILVHE